MPSNYAQIAPLPQIISAPLIYSRTTDKALKSNTLSKYVKKWCGNVGIVRNFSLHTVTQKSVKHLNVFAFKMTILAPFIWITHYKHLINFFFFRSYKKLKNTQNFVRHRTRFKVKQPAVSALAERVFLIGYKFGYK